MGDPPSDDGAAHVRFTVALPGVAIRPVGAPGVVRGVALTVALLALPVPAVLMAAMVNAYVVPLARPVHEALRLVTTQVPSAGVTVTE